MEVDTQVSVAELRVLRGHAARLAEVFARRWADAIAGEDYYSAAYWSGRYAGAAARCLELGRELRRPSPTWAWRPLRAHALGSPR